jgi:hypothetical protein
LAALIVLPENQAWWLDIHSQLEYSRSFSTYANSTLIWAVLAYAFTLLDMFTGDLTDDINRNGQGIGALWLWLVPVLFIWLKLSPRTPISKGEIARLVNRINEADAFVLGENGLVQPSKSESDWAISVIDKFRDAPIYRDQACTAPIYNYSRILSWTESCQVISAVFKEAHAPSRSPQKILYLAKKAHESSLWESGVFRRMGFAFFFSLLLQWGTAGSAIIVVWYAPTPGEFISSVSL